MRHPACQLEDRWSLARGAHSIRLGADTWHTRKAVRRTGRAGRGRLRADLGFDLVGGTGFEPVTSSVSGNDVGRSCFRILFLKYDVSSASVHRCLSLPAAIVTQLVTRSPVSMSSAAHSSGGSWPTASLPADRSLRSHWSTSGPQIPSLGLEHVSPRWQRLACLV